jgi:hypothetical protein
MKRKRRAPESKYRPTRCRKLTPAEIAHMLPRGIQLAFRDAEARGKTVPVVGIAEEIVPLSPLTPSQREAIAAVVKLKAEDWDTIHRARLEYLWSARQDNLGVTTLDMEKATDRIHKAARRFMDVLNDNSEPHNIAWTRIRDVGPPTLPPGIIIPAFDLDSIYPIISQLSGRTHLVCKAAAADHRAKPNDDLTHFDRPVGELADVFEARVGRRATAPKPTDSNTSPPQSRFEKFFSGVWSTLPRDVCQHPQQGTTTAIKAAVAKSLALRR